MNILAVVNQMAVLVSLLAVGFAAGRLKVLTPDGNRVLTKIVLYIALPCTIINSVFGNSLGIEIDETLFFLLVCFLSFGIAFVIAMPLVRLSRGDKANHGLLTYMSVFSNCAFMGFPATLAIFGAASGLYTAIFNIPFNLLSFSVGIILIAGKHREAAASGNGAKFNPKLLINPPLIASLLAVAVTLTGIRFPYAVTETIRLTGGITTPGAMIVIGSTLAYIPVRNVFSEWRVVLSSALRLVIIPLVTWLVFRNFIADGMMLGVLVVLSGMPTAAQSTMFAIQYGGNEKIASAGVFVTTVLCVFTTPLLVYLLL